MTLRKLAASIILAGTVTAIAVAQETQSSAEKQVEAGVRAFFDGMSKATCEDGSPVSRLARDKTIYVLETEIYRVPQIEYEQGVRDRACKWVKHDGGVDEIVVEVHAPNVATAAWTFHDIITRKDGSVRRSKGAVMQTWVKYENGWQIAATKSSEDHASATIDPAPGK